MSLKIRRSVLKDTISQEKLRQMVKLHNDWLRSITATEVYKIKDYPNDGQRLDISNILVANVQIVRWDLTSANFQYAELKNVAFYNCDFESTIFSDCTFEGCSFLGCDFEKGEMRNIEGFRTDFSNSNFQRTNIRNSDFSESNFSYCNFRSTAVIDSDLRNIRLEQSIFDNTKLFNSKLHNTKKYKLTIKQPIVGEDIDISSDGDKSELVDADKALRELLEITKS